jgi:hypothetical protein
MRRMRWLSALGLGVALTGFGATRCLAQSGYPQQIQGAPPPGLGSQTGLMPAPTISSVGDPYEGIRITPQAGAWSICIASFAGDDAPEFAHQMVAYVRNDHHMPCYVYDRADQQRRKDNDAERLRAQRDPTYRPQYTRVEELCAILVGSYPTVEAANVALKEVHKWPMPNIHLSSGLPPFATQFKMVLDKKGNSVLDDQKRPIHTTMMLNPCETAFAIRNPTLADGQMANKSKFDPAWPKLNENEEFSVYKCSKPWTLAVIKYNGLSTTQTGSSSMLYKLWGNNHEGESLNVAANNAHELAKALRACNLDAYVLHTKTSSIVTIGGFASFDDPNIKSAKQTILAVRQKIDENARAKNAVSPPFFNNPLPMEVPR